MSHDTTPDMHKVVIVFAINRGELSTQFGGFAKRLQNAGHLKNCEITTVALEDIIFDIANGKHTHTLVNGTDPFAQADFVYFKSWEKYQEVAGALAVSLKARGIPFVDRFVEGVGFSKLPMMMRFWSNSIPIPHTIYGMNLDILAIEKYIGYPMVVKAVHGQKGRDNYLVSSQNELEEISTKVDIKNFIIQEYIPNEGDYRIWVYGSKVRGGLFRKSSSEGHVHNTSQGATAQLLQVSDIASELSEIAIKSAQASHLAISGVDIMQNSKTGDYYVLEANQGSQVVTGAFVAEKMQAFDEGLSELLEKRFLRKKTSVARLDMVGRHVAVDFPDWNITGMIGKVDTGAYQAALHAEDIVEDEQNHTLTFKVAGFENKEHSVVEPQVVSVTDYSFAEVRNTSGVLERRYLVPVRFSIKGRIFRSKVTLTNRGTMKYPLLIGRRTLRGRFLVNSELSKRTSL
jgi:glutathione synthase/RimK-type ligase-like ATP-grasp enzyme